MRIGLDCRLGGLAHAGIGRYIENLAIRLPLAAPQHSFVYFFRNQKQINDSPEFQKCVAQSKNVKVVLAPILHYSLAEQFQLPPIFYDEHLDLLHIPHFNAPIFYNRPFVITIHDLLWHENQGFNVTTLPPWLYLIKYVGYRFVAGKAITKAQTIFVPAETVKQTLISYYPKAKNKVVVTKEGIGKAFLDAPTPDHSKRTKKIVYLGSLYPHKNIEVILQALPKLSNYELVLVGSRNVFQDAIRSRVKELKIEKQVRFAGYLSDEKVIAELQTATALVQPSLSEGFGLTGLEAMATGSPVIASDIPIFHEIYGEAATFFDPHLSDAFVVALKKMSENPTTNIKKGYQQIKEYSWDEMVKKTVESYDNIP